MNASRRFSGYTDVDLNEEGFKQAEKLRERLAGERIDAVYCSDLKRTVSTAEVISRGQESEFTRCFELRELHYGDAEGLTFDEITAKFPHISEGLRNSFLDLDFPGGEDFNEFSARVCTFPAKLKDHPEEHTVLIVAHGGSLRTLVCHFLGIGQEHWRKFRFDNCSLSIIDLYSERVILSLLNDTTHLTEKK